MKQAILLLLTSLTFAQSPWTREKGKTYLQVGFTSLSYNSFQLNGKKVDIAGKVNDQTFQIYSEYGLTKNLEAQVILPYKVIAVDNSLTSKSTNLSGFGNLTFGLKYKWFDKNWKISSGIIYSANSIKIDAVNSLSTGFNAATILPYISVGTSINKWYYFANIGYGYMNNNYSDYLKATFEVGYNIIENGHLIFVLDTRNIINKESAFLKDTAQWSSYLDRQTFNAIGLKANYEFSKDKFGANFAAIGATGIDNAPLAPTFNVGIYSKF